MERVVWTFRWLKQPKLCIGFVIACLLLSAWGSIASSLVRPLVLATAPRVKAAATAASQPPDCTAHPCIALTFDDGPDRTITPQILDILQREQVPATFFLVGREIAGKEDLVRRIHAEGHVIGNHTWNHPRLPLLSPEGVRSEVQRTQAAIVGAGAIPAPSLFRPPYGEITPMVRANVPLTMVRWDVDTEDWLTRDAGKVYEHLVHDVHPGAIILLHDKYEATAQALGPAIQALKPSYQFVTVDQLLQLSPGDQGQFFNRVP